MTDYQTGTAGLRGIQLVLVRMIVDGLSKLNARESLNIAEWILSGRGNIGFPYLIFEHEISHIQMSTM